MARAHYLVSSGVPGYCVDTVSVYPSRRAAERGAAWELRDILSCLNDPGYTGNSEDAIDPLRPTPGYSFREHGMRYIENARQIFVIDIYKCDCGDISAHMED